MLKNETSYRRKKIKKILENKEKEKGRHPIIALPSPNLKKLRENIPIDSKPYTQKELAEILNIEEKLYGKIERQYKDKNGVQSNLSFENALKLSMIYDVSLDYLYGFVRKRESATPILSLLQDIIKFEDTETQEKIVLKVNKEVISYLMKNAKLEEKNKKVKKDKRRNDYIKYLEEKTKLEENIQKEILNSKNEVGYYLLDIEKTANNKHDYEMNNYNIYLEGFNIEDE